MHEKFEIEMSAKEAGNRMMLVGFFNLPMFLLYAIEVFILFGPHDWVRFIIDFIPKSLAIAKNTEAIVDFLERVYWFAIVMTASYLITPWVASRMAPYSRIWIMYNLQIKKIMTILHFSLGFLPL